MKIIYSLNKLKNKFEWEEKYNLIFFLLSYFLTKKNISQNIIVYVDNFYKKILHDLGFQNVILFNQSEYVMFEAKHKAIYKNLLQKEPFAFFDNDIFCFKPINFNSNITCYAIEPDNFFQSLAPHAKILLDIDYKQSFNTGIFYFPFINNSIIEYYKKYIIDMYKKTQIRRNDMIVCDQYVYLNKLLMDGIVDKIDVIYNKSWDDADLLNEKQICHLIGAAKQNPKLMFFAEESLKKLWPAIFEKIENIDYEKNC